MSPGPSGTKLYFTPLSHFARKVRLVLDFYSVPYELLDVDNVAQTDVSRFGGNPLMSVPVLVDGDVWMIESDSIAQYLSLKHDPADQLGILTRDLSDLNVRAVLNGVMGNEVKWILAQRMSVPVERYSYFSKSLKSIQHGLEWLEANASVFTTDAVTYRELHLVSAWDHLDYYGLVPLSAYGKLGAVVERVSRETFVRRTAPQVLRPKSAPV